MFVSKFGIITYPSSGERVKLTRTFNQQNNKTKDFINLQSVLIFMFVFYE